MDEQASQTTAAPARRRQAAEFTPPAKPEKKKESTLEFIASIAVVLVVGLFIITFNLQAFEIPSSSMENTLLIGDHVFVNRIGFAPKTNWLGGLEPYRTPQRGDIVVFLSLTDPGMHIVKRIIGEPGDRIRLRYEPAIDPKTGQPKKDPYTGRQIMESVLYRNGQRVDESAYARHCTEDALELQERLAAEHRAPTQDQQYLLDECGPMRASLHDPYRDEFPSVPPGFGATTEWRASMRSYMRGDEIVVPPGRYFGMGDNRDVSFDSRYWGFIPQENIIGRPMFIYWSFDTPPDQASKSAISERLAFVGHVIIHFFTETRWSRTFHLVR
jgi:signal peptidase I